MGIYQSATESYGKANVRAVLISVTFIVMVLISGVLIGVGETNIMSGEATVTVSNESVSSMSPSLIRANYEEAPAKDQAVIDAAIKNGSGTATYTDVVSLYGNPSVSDGSPIQQAAQESWRSGWDGNVNDMRTENAGTYIVVENRPDTPPTPLSVSVTYTDSDSYTTNTYLVWGGIALFFISLVGSAVAIAYTYQGIQIAREDEDGEGDEEQGSDDGSDEDGEDADTTDQTSEETDNN